MKKNIYLLLFLFIQAFTVWSQPPGEGWTLTIQGNLAISDFNIQDWYTRKRFIDKEVNVTVYKEDSVTFLTDQVWYGGSTVNGKKLVSSAEAYVPVLKRIVVKVEKEGYDTFLQAFDIPDETHLKKRKDGKYYWNGLPKILIRKSLKTRELGEATVTASRLQMVVKGDTLEYNVANLQLSAGSMLENLIQSLPGAKLDRNGRITVNGEFVQRLLVNGRAFFDGDPLVALKNLPYYTVGKVKVYHNIGSSFKNKSDSLRALSRAQLTMDVRLKRQYSEMWLANFEVGGGSRTHTDWNSVYFGRFFAMRFTDHSSIGIYGIANNVGKNYSAMHDGNWREMQASSGGMPTTQSGGVDFSVDGKKSKLKFKTTLNLMHEENDLENRISNQTFLSTGDIFDRMRSTDHSREFSADWKSSLSRDEGGVNFSVSPKFFYKKGDVMGNGLSASFDDDPMDRTRTASLDSIWGESASSRLSELLIKKSRSMSNAKNSLLLTGASVNVTVPLNGRRHILPLDATVDYSRSTYEQMSVSNVVTRNSAYFENTFSSTPSHSFRWSASTMHFFHLVGNSKYSLSGRVSYAYNHEYKYAERALYKNGDEQPDWLPDMHTGYAWEYNLRNSYFTDNYSDNHTVGWNLDASFPGIREGKSVDVRMEVPFHADVRKVVDMRHSREQEVRKTFCYFTPSLVVTAMDYALDGRYQLRTSLPQMNDLLDIYDDAASLYRMMGNPDLKRETSHEFSLTWKKNNWKKMQSYSIDLSSAIMRDHITTARTYNRETAVTTSKPENINGNWWASAKASLGHALDAKKLFNATASAYYTFAHSVDFSSDAEAAFSQRFTVYNNRVGGSASVSYNKQSVRASLEAKVAWNGLTSAAPEFRNMSYTDMNYMLSFAMPIVGSLAFDTDFKLSMRRGYHEPSMNTTEWVWNAALSTKLDRSGQWVLRAVAFDILHNLSNVRNTINAQGHMEWWTNSVQSYASLHLVYHIKVKPSKKGIGK